MHDATNFRFNTGGEAFIYPADQKRPPLGPRPSQFGASNAVQELSRRVDALLATMPKSAPTRATAAPTPDQGDEIDAGKIFAARRAACDGTTRKPEPATPENIFSTGGDAVFQARG